MTYLRSASTFLLFAAAIFGFMGAILGDTPLGEQLGGGMLLSLAMAVLCRLPVWARGFLRGPQLRPRPKQRSRSLLSAPGAWKGYNTGLLLVWLGALVLVVALPDSVAGGLLGLLSLPVALALLIHQLIEPGAAAERRTLAAQLEAGLRAGVPLVELLEQFQLEASRGAATRHRPLPLVLHWLAFDLRCGSLFSTAVATQSYFPPLWSALLRVGERTGKMPDCLHMLACWEANQPRRLYLIRPLVSLPIVLFLARLISNSVLFEGEVLPETAFHSLHSPFLAFISFSFLLALISLLGPWLGRHRRFHRLTQAMQKLPWVWPLAHVEEQLLAITALEAAASVQGTVQEMVELARGACGRDDFRQSLDPGRAAAGDTLAELLRPNFEPEVVALVAAGEVDGNLEDCLHSGRLFLEGRLNEERSRVELRFLVGFQILTGMLVLCSALEYLLSLQTMYLTVLEGI